MEQYDVIVIGGGPGGYVCAVRAAQLGLKTACVEARPTLGGTCLNVGCIPSKALLHASHMYHEAKHNFERMGIKRSATSVNWERMLAYKDETISANTTGIEFLFRKNSVAWLKGQGRIIEQGKIDVDGTVYEAANIVIATGSVPSSLPNVEIDETVIVTSTGALALKSLPASLTIIGAGIIGLELGSVYARLGSKVTVLEYLDRITPGIDDEVAAAFAKILVKQGITITLGAAVQSATVKRGKASVAYSLQDGSDGKVNSDVVLVATGRKPFTAGLGAEACGIKTDAAGRIVTDAAWRTSIDGIFAIGDVTDGPMLAHKAEDEGMAVAETIAGRAGHVNYGVIPSVIYTHPELAAVGRSEEELKAEGRSYRVGKFPFIGNGRAKAAFAADGFVKLLADAASDRILGCHLIGPAAGDLIHEVCVAMEFGAAAEDLARTCHAHPTYSEAMREAALACGDGAIHA